MCDCWARVLRRGGHRRRGTRLGAGGWGRAGEITKFDGADFPLPNPDNPATWNRARHAASLQLISHHRYSFGPGPASIVLRIYDCLLLSSGYAHALDLHCLFFPFAFQIDKLATQAVVAYQPFLYGRHDRSTDDGSGARFCTNETRWRNAGSNQAPSLESGALAQFILSLPWYHRLRSVCES